MEGVRVPKGQRVRLSYIEFEGVKKDYHEDASLLLDEEPAPMGFYVLPDCRGNEACLVQGKQHLLSKELVAVYN